MFIKVLYTVMEGEREEGRRENFVKTGEKDSERLTGERGREEGE